ncbi:MAG: hypothetical protein ACFFG0_40745, partial [Candidatus Thorarchaeota archaeon]
MKVFTGKSDKKKQRNFYIQVIQDILISNPEAFELLKNLAVINSELETNIDRKSIELGYKLKNPQNVFDDLLNKGLLKEKEGKEEILEFSSPYIQDAFGALADEISHKQAIKYYETKRNKYDENLNDVIEMLFHKAKLEPNEELVNKFL